jgi:hypothetical protein
MRTLLIFDKLPFPAYTLVLQFRQSTHDHTDRVSTSAPFKVGEVPSTDCVAGVLDVSCEGIVIAVSNEIHALFIENLNSLVNGWIGIC